MELCYTCLNVSDSFKTLLAIDIISGVLGVLDTIKRWGHSLQTLLSKRKLGDNGNNERLENIHCITFCSQAKREIDSVSKA